MGKFRGEFPYDNYWVYAPIYHNKEKRNYAVLINVDDCKNRTTISYSRYLLSVSIGRILTENEEVDHINNIKDDDRVENLQILTRKENNNKYVNDKVYHTEVKLICPNCRKIFIRNVHNTFLSKGGVFTSCSRHCCGVIRRNLQLGRDVNLSDNVVEIYKVKTTI